MVGLMGFERLRFLRRCPLVWALLLITLLLVLWLSASFAVAYRLTRRHRPPFHEPVPAVSWARFESHRLRTRDGQELGAWLIQGTEQAPSVVLLHGNGGSRIHCLSRAEMLAAEGCTLLLVSLRAHGDSTGEVNDIGFSARHDVVAAVEFLERSRPGKPILVHGASLGAAAALFASEALGHRVSGYILESPYKDLKTAVRNRTENALPPLLDWIAFRGLLTAASFVLPHWEQISPLAAIGGIPGDVPVLILAGSEDRSARLEEAKALHERVRSHASLVLFERGGHMNFPEIAPERYRQAVLGFLRSLRVGRSPGVARRVGSRTKHTAAFHQANELRHREQSQDGGDADQTATGGPDVDRR
jgi:pimeloyl-ACP methyl ester carboxylesterase